MPTAAPELAANANIILVPVEGVDDFWAQIDQAKTCLDRGALDAALARFLVAWGMLDDRLARMMAVQEISARLCIDDQEQTELAARVTNMNGMMMWVEEICLRSESAATIPSQLKGVMDRIKQRRGQMC